MAVRNRPIQILFCINEKEKAMMDKKLENSGYKNMGAFIRKMILTGYVLNVDFKPINKQLSLLSHCSNNLNQLARKANSYEAITSEDMAGMRKIILELHETNKLLLDKIGSL